MQLGKTGQILEKLRITDFMQLREKMRLRDKIMTAACLFPEGLEWTSIKIRQEGNETVDQSRSPFPLSMEEMEEFHLDEALREKLEGDLSVAIRSSELLMRTMEFPTADPDEIASMVSFQVDKFSPFPLEQLAISHEILKQDENSALVLMVAVKHERIDAVGDLFAHKGVHIHSIDVRMLGWLHLLEQEDHLAGTPCELVVIHDGLDYVLAVLENKIPIAFRSLPLPETEKDLAAELADEISYTLTTLDADYDLPAPTAIDIWYADEFKASTLEDLHIRTKLDIGQHDLATLPPLSQGIIDRTLSKESRIELIPREWIEHQRIMELKRKFILSSSVMGAIWLALMLVFTVVYQTRAFALRSVQKKEAALAPAANKAIENRQKLRALKGYADRSESALECLREATLLLPPGDIEFVAFNYSRNKGLSLRGTAENKDMVYQYTDALSDSDLFEQLKDERIDTKVTKGVERAIFSANLVLSSQEDD
jgi:hypothetical protein